MQRHGSPNDHVLMVAAPAILNLACFVLDAAGLVSHTGYQTGRLYHWPYQERTFRDTVDAVTFVDAAYQWPHWWEDLVNERYKVITENIEAHDLEWSNIGLPPSLDPYPALRQAVAIVWPTFWGWWLYPYVGGKMALESIELDREQRAHEKLQDVVPGRWHWDLVYRADMRQMRYHARVGWGIVHPNDFWRLDWISVQAFA